MTDTFLISGIQQIGIGVPDARAAFRWLRHSFGMDVPMFDDEGEAGLMARYTGGQVHRRHAVLAANLHGGSAAEIWQFTSRAPQPPGFRPAVGDLGILAARVKSPDAARSRRLLESRGTRLLGPLGCDPAGVPHFFLEDPEGNLFEVTEASDWLTPPRAARGGTGGFCGCLIGVRDVEAARALYGGLLGFERVLADYSGVFEDLAALPGGNGRVRRVLLGPAAPRRGAFSRLLGESRIELVQALEREPRRIREGRFWGDPGFIHLCFDVRGMDRLREACGRRGFPFTVDSAGSFDMGDAAGRFAYVEDPDGTLVEFVETHRIPVYRRLGLYIDLRRRDPERPLPRWMFRAFSLARVRD